MRHIATTASALTVLAAVGYVIGWFYVTAYFLEFDASWLLPYVPTSTFLSHIEWPIALLGTTILFSFMEKPKFIWDPEIQEIILRYGLVVMFVLMLLLSGPLRSRVRLSVVTNITFINMLVWVVVVAYSVKLVSTFLRNENRSWDQWGHLVIFFALFGTFGGLYMVPRTLGAASALYDLDPRASTLHTVEMLGVDGRSETSRLLLATDARIYTVDLDAPDARKNVNPVPWDRVISIGPPQYGPKKGTQTFVPDAR